MRTGLTIAVHLGGEITELIAGFEAPIDVQRADFKKLQAIKTHEVFERVEFWESGIGRVKRHQFDHVQAKPEAPIPNPAGKIMEAISEPAAPAAPAAPAVEDHPDQEAAQVEPEPESAPEDSNGFETAPRRRGRPAKSVKG